MMQNDFSAMLAIAEALHQKPATWKATIPLSTWEGVTVAVIDGQERVTGLFLENAGGVLAPEIGELRALRSLDIFCTTLNSPLPVSIGNLHTLKELGISNNALLPGPLPDVWAALPDLEVLEIYNNPLLQGPLQPSVACLGKLKQLSLSHISMSQAFKAFSCLEYLELCMLDAFDTASVPVWLFNQKNLRTLYLKDFDLSQGLPDSVENLVCLEALILNGCGLPGVPSSFTFAGGQQDSVPLDMVSTLVPECLKAFQNFQTLRVENNSSTGMQQRNSVGQTQAEMQVEFLDEALEEAPGDFSSDAAALMAIAAEFTICPMNWDPAVPVDEWNGVGFGYRNGTRRIVRLEIAYAEGALAAEIGLLPCLEELIFTNTNISGEVPESITGLSQLKIFVVSGASFFPNLPLFFEQLGALEHITLQHSPLSIFPAMLTSMPGVRELTLDSCSGGVFPASLGAFSGLKKLVLRSLDSVVLPEIFGKFPFLQELVIENILLERLPESLERLSQLPAFTKLTLAQTGLTNFPAWLGDLQGLTELTLCRNSLQGPIPHFLCHLPLLQYLCLDYNKLNGAIPQEICCLTELQCLKARSNALSGEVPECICGLPLKVIDLAGNALTMTRRVQDFVDAIAYDMRHPFLRYLQDVVVDMGDDRGLRLELYNVPQSFYLYPGHEDKYLASKETRSTFWGKVQRFWVEVVDNTEGLEEPEQAIAAVLPEVQGILQDMDHMEQALYRVVAEWVYPSFRENAVRWNAAHSEPDRQVALPPMQRASEVLFIVSILVRLVFENPSGPIIILEVGVTTYEEFGGGFYQVTMVEGEITEIEQL